MFDKLPIQGYAKSWFHMDVDLLILQIKLYPVWFPHARNLATGRNQTADRGRGIVQVRILSTAA